MIGYMTIYLAPAQWNNKTAKFTLRNLKYNFLVSLEKYKTLSIVLFMFIILFIISCYIRINMKKIMIALFFFIGSLLSNFMMIVAGYYPDRCFAGSSILLIAAVAVLGATVYKNENYKIALVSVAALMTISSFYYLCVGINDIYNTNSLIRKNEQIIYQSKQKGELDISLPLFLAETKYSAAKDGRYISAETSQTWPNESMAKYYGVNSIIGKWE